MALHGCSSVSRAARSSKSVVSIGASDPSSPKDLSLPLQESDRTHALSFYVTCDSCAVVLWVRAVCSDCFSLLRALHKSPPNELDRHAPSERGLLGHPSQCSQLWPVKTISIVVIRRMSHHHVSAFGASPGHHRLPSLPTVHCTSHVLLDECEASSTEPPSEDESRRSSSEFAERACIRTSSGFLKCVDARSATT